MTAPQAQGRPLDPERIEGAFEVLYHVGGSGGRYQCRWCRAEAYTHGVEFPHGVDCPTRTLRKQADSHAALRAALLVLVGEMGKDAKAESEEADRWAIAFEKRSEALHRTLAQVHRYYATEIQRLLEADA